MLRSFECEPLIIREISVLSPCFTFLESYNFTNVKEGESICSTVKKERKVKYSHITHILQVIHAHNMLTKVKKMLRIK